MTSSATPAEEAYDDILRTARRFTRSADEARDLAQDALLIALGRGLEDWASPSRRAWLHGVVRKRAAFLVRGHTRRRRREQLTVEDGQRKPGRWSWEPSFLARLPRSLKAVATLASADLCTAEIQWLLGLSNTAIRSQSAGGRQRLGRRFSMSKPNLKISGIAVIFMVQELERTRRFYAEALGLELAQMEDYLVGTLPGGTELLFFVGEAERGASPQIVFGLDQGGIDTAAEALAERGIQLLTPVTEAPGGWSLEFHDPDGHPLAFFQEEALPRRL